MVLVSRRQAELLEELAEWREDMRERGIGSCVVLLVAPAGWGRLAVLARFRAAVEAALFEAVSTARWHVLRHGDLGISRRDCACADRPPGL